MAGQPGQQTQAVGGQQTNPYQQTPVPGYNGNGQQPLRTNNGPRPAGPPGMPQGAPSNMGPRGPDGQPTNVYQQSANNLTQAGQFTTQAGNYQPQQVSPTGINPAFAGPSQQYMAQNTGSAAQYNAAGVQAGQLSNTSLAPYQNPFQQQVTNRTLTGLERQRQMAENTMGASASAAGAFGGSRHGVAEAETNRGFASAGADALANLNSQGYQQAVQGAQFDIGNRLDAGMANQNAQNQSRQFNAGQRSDIQFANQNAQNQSRQFNAGQRSDIQFANQNAQNNTRQFNSAQNMQGQLANQNAGLTANGYQMQAGGQLGQLSNLGFNMGQQINGQQQQQGSQQQALQQALMNAAQGQFRGFTGSPNASLQSLLAGLGGANMGQQSTTQSNQPGLLNLLSLFMGA